MSKHVGQVCIVRSYNAGVFLGKIESLTVTEAQKYEATISNARRLWYWDGASSLSELARRGSSRPKNCKFPCPVPEVSITDVIEILPVSDKVAEHLYGIPEWTQH
jgi:hypothetical protein